MKNNPLFDLDFLYELDHYRNRIVYVRIISLTSNNLPIEQIEGVATGGNITIDGSSAVRRICSLTMTTKNLNINNIYWGLNARIKIEVGLENKFNKNYPDIIWFPQGVFLITEFKTNSQVNNYVITLTGKDKMCLLNGDIGGVFNAETDIGCEEYWDHDAQKMVKEIRPLNYIIREMIHHYAKEDFGNIIIKLEAGKEILRNKTNKTLYVIEDINDNYSPVDIISSDAADTHTKYYYMGSHREIDFSNIKEGFIFHFTADEDNSTLIAGETYALPTRIEDASKKNFYVIKRVLHNEDIGYRFQDLFFPEDLIAAPGDTVTSILDKIIQRFPTYEYFYNLQGQFVFQPKATYINTSWNNIISYENENFILPMMLARKTQYSFEGNQIITAFANNPKLNEIKNDFTVWGKKTLSSGQQVPIHMRYAIDRKPSYYVSFKKEKDKPILYMTKEYQEYLGEYLISQHTNEWIEKKSKPPQYLLSAQYYSYEHYIADKTDDLVQVEYTPDELNEKWWNITEWGQYYEEIFGEKPHEVLRNYGTTGAIFSCEFPDGSILTVNQKRANIIPTPPCMSITIPSLSNRVINISGPLLIFDVDLAGYAAQGGAPYFGKINTLSDGRKMYSWNPFQHGLTSCGHTYKQFLDRAEGNDHLSGATANNHIQSWIYCPEIPKDKRQNITKELVDLQIYYNIKIVDWREIIFQMAEDYYARNHDDDFHYELFRNNDLTSFNVPRIYDLMGMTGYEQYYHDIQGFWRTLYIPRDEKEEYFSHYRLLVGVKKNLPACITWAEDNESFTYDSQKKGQYTVVSSLSTPVVEFYLGADKKIYNLETDKPLTSGNGNNRIVYTLDLLVKRDLAIKREKEILDAKQAELNSKWEAWRKANQIAEYSPNSTASSVINTAKNRRAALQSEINTLSTEVNNKYEAIQYAINAICPYSLRYSCEKNEIDFYKSIDFTPNGYPIYTDYERDSEEEKLIGDFNKNIVYDPQNLLFWIDFWDPDSLGLGQFSVPAIGARPKVESNDLVGALVYQDVPDLLFINEEDYDNDPTNPNYDGYQVIVLKKNNFLRLAIENGYIVRSARKTTALETIDNMVYQDAYCNEEVTLTSVPVYYLEPNSIISARDEYQLVNGYYILNKMVIPLTYNGTMKNTCIRVPERIY